MAKTKKPRKKKLPDPIQFTKVVMRRASLRWYARQEVFKRIMVTRGAYRCEGCEQLFKRDHIQVDHIDPVVDIKTGFTDIETWLRRLLVTADKLQGLCAVPTGVGDEKIGCHSQKTFLENEMREFYKEQTKKKGKKK